MSGDSVQLRGYLAGDVDRMYALDVACFEPVFRFTRSMMRRFAEAKYARVVIAESGEEMVGFGILHVERVEGAPVGYVMTLDVAEAWRRQGVARLLMVEMERQAREAGCTEMALHVFPGNEAAVRFYEREEYVRSHTARGFYGAGLDAWVYRKVL